MPARDKPLEDDDDEQTTISAVAVRRVEVASIAPRLELVAGSDDPQSFFLDRPEMTIGRAEGCEIRVTVGDLSRQHARVTVRDGVVQIEDLKSRNGVLLNSVKVRAARLSQGDQVQLGAVLFVFHEGHS